MITIPVKNKILKVSVGTFALIEYSRDVDHLRE
jgi:hypothetical protein